MKKKLKDDSFHIVDKYILPFEIDFWLYVEI